MRKERRDPEPVRAEAMPALIFDPAVSAFVWANSAGLALFGVKSIQRLTQDRLDRALPAAAQLMAFAGEGDRGPSAMSLDFWSARGPVHIDAVVERLALSRDRDGVLIRSTGTMSDRPLPPRVLRSRPDTAGREEEIGIAKADAKPPEMMLSQAPAIAAQCRASAELSREDEETLREIARLIREGELTELPDRTSSGMIAPPIDAEPPAGAGRHPERSAPDGAVFAAEQPDGAGSELNGEAMRLLAEVSHELRTPLTAIRGYGELIAAKPGDSRVGDRARHIVEAADHVLALIGDILDARQVATGQADLIFTDVDLVDEIEQAAAMVAPQAAQAGVTLITTPSTRLPKVVADARRVRQVLINLAGNAVKFTAPGGTVQLDAISTSDGGLEVSVSDTGRGMAPAELAEVLRTERIAPRRQSRGIGLPLSRALAEANGARLSIESRSGAGTIAYLRFSASSVVPP